MVVIKIIENYYHRRRNARSVVRHATDRGGDGRKLRLISRSNNKSIGQKNTTQIDI